MQAGFALVEAGSVTKRNIVEITLKVIYNKGTLLIPFVECTGRLSWSGCVLACWIFIRVWRCRTN